jgi:hypothetical protein
MIRIQNQAFCWIRVQILTWGFKPKNNKITAYWKVLFQILIFHEGSYFSLIRGNLAFLDPDPFSNPKSGSSPNPKTGFFPCDDWKNFLHKPDFCSMWEAFIACLHRVYSPLTLSYNKTFSSPLSTHFSTAIPSVFAHSLSSSSSKRMCPFNRSLRPRYYGIWSEIEP